MNNKLFFFFSILLGLVMFSSFDHNPPVKVLKESTITQKDSAKTIFKVNDSITIENNKTYIIYKKGAHASYYHDKFTGRKTASGQIFDNKKMTAAHKKLPFGSKVRVTNEANGKSVIVTVNDRGPFARFITKSIYGNHVPFWTWCYESYFRTRFRKINKSQQICWLFCLEKININLSSFSSVVAELGLSLHSYFKNLWIYK
jgi:rare lipoprotein A